MNRIAATALTLPILLFGGVACAQAPALDEADCLALMMLPMDNWLAWHQKANRLRWVAYCMDEYPTLEAAMRPAATVQNPNVWPGTNIPKSHPVALALCSDGREGLVDLSREPYASKGSPVSVNAQGQLVMGGNDADASPACRNRQ